MLQVVQTAAAPRQKSGLDRVLSLFTDVRPGEGATAVLMLVNIFLLLLCYSVIKTVREPLILLGGGAEVRSYAAAGQALLLMGFVPLYSWVASRVDRIKLLVGVTLFFVGCIELFSVAVSARVPYVGVAFFIWVGIFNVSLVAQFWSFANDLYSKEAGDRLFPIIVMGMTAGAPFGSWTAARLFGLGIAPQVILQVSAVVLWVSVVLYVLINRRQPAAPRGTRETAMPGGGGFGLVLGSRYLRLIAALVVLLNVVNTTGEYLVARLLTTHVKELALADPTFNQQAFIGAFSGDYQFWVNVVAFLLQAFVASRLVKYKGLRGVLLVLPLIALGGYALIAAGVGFSIVRWTKTAENATDYSLMNTARQLLWLPTTREEKYKAKQAIDAFFVRAGDVLSAAVVYLGTHVMTLTPQQFAFGNVVLTVVWLGIAFRLLGPTSRVRSGIALRPMAAAGAAAVVLVAIAAPAMAQQTRQALKTAERADKALRLHPYVPNPLERRLEAVDRAISSERPLYLFMGGPMEGSGLAIGPGYRARYGDTGAFNAHATWSVANYKDADLALTLPTFGDGRFRITTRANWVDAPEVAFFGVGSASTNDRRTAFRYRATTAGASVRMAATKHVAVGTSFDTMRFETAPATAGPSLAPNEPTYRTTALFAEFDSRTAPEYSRRGGLYRVEWSDYRQINGRMFSFRRADVEVQQFVPILRENWGLALRALASTTDTDAGEDVPYFLMPDLGGSHELRGFPSWRFRDRHRVLLTGEYRWTAGPLMDMAVFVDAGKVAARRADLTLANLELSQGLGVRLHTPSATLTRIEVAHSREGVRLIFSFSPSF